MSMLAPRTLLTGNFHRHFGWHDEDSKNILHFLQRRAASHGVLDGATIYYCKSTDGGYSVGPETAIIPSVAGFDNRGISACVLDDDRIFVLYGAVPVPIGAGVLLKTGWIENGVWTPGQTIYTSAYDETCLPYGPIKKLPNGKLIATPYYQINATTYRLAVWQFDADGTNPVELTPIYEGALGYNETDFVAVDHKVSFCVSRGSGIQLFVSVDGLQSWSYIGELPDTDSQCVAPTIERFEYNGEIYLLCGYCDRTPNQMTFRIAKAPEAINSASAFDKAMAIGSDYVNASGYQSLPVTKEGDLKVGGGTYFVVYKEYDDNSYSDVRLVPFNPLSLLAPPAPPARVYMNNISLAGSITAGSNTYTATGKNGYYEDRGKSVKLSGRVMLSGPIDPATNGVLEILCPDMPLSLNDAAARCVVSFAGTVGVTVTKELTGFVLENSRKIRLQDGHNFSATLTKANISSGAQIYFDTEYWKA